jgi:hypothetical protein
MRSAPGAAPAAASGNDPLAELARLIGQNDPFAEYGRENARRAAQQAAAPAPPAPVYADDRYAAAPAHAAQHQDFAPDDQQFGNYPQQFGAAPGFQPRAQVPSYPPEDAGYEGEAEYPTNANSSAEDHDFYDDVPPRRRMGILAIAAVFALAVIGTAGAFGYRALFGSSGASSPPPVIKADSSPTKIVPAASSKDPKSGKLIYDRVAERGQDEKLVSREEQPVDRPTGAAKQQDQTAGSIQPPMGSGVVATEPKKVHTIAIRPDGTAIADAAPTPAVANVPQPAPVAAPALAAPAPRAPAAEPAPRQAVARAEPPPPPPHRVVASAPSNAPLSLSPDAPEQPAPAPRPTRAAVTAPPTQIAPAQTAAPARPAPTSIAPTSGGGIGYAVQVSSQRSEADAQAAFRGLQAKFPGQLGGKQPMIRQVDLGAKGIYYRAMVGPLGSEEASQLCSSLKAAGGQCIVQRI